MNWKWPRNLTGTMDPKIILILICLVAIGSCRSGSDLRELERVMTMESLTRLNDLPAEASVLLSLEGTESMTGPTDLGEDGKQLGSFGNLRLVTLTRSRVPTLAATPGLKSMVVWGDAAIVGKLDPRLRQDMLIRLTSESSRKTPLSIEARFDGDPVAMRQNLEKMGAFPRSVNAGVATLDATVDVLFEILARPDLVSLSKPVLQKPLQAR